MTTKEVNFSWELAQPRLSQWLYEKDRQDFFIILIMPQVEDFCITLITIAPLVEHWHGATPDAWFTHLAISTNPQTGESQWLEPVTQQDYDAAARVAKK